MKKTLLSLSLIFSIALNAQLTQGNHAPALGNSIFSTRQCDSSAITPSAPGANQIWSYGLSGLNNSLTYSTTTSNDITFNPSDISVTASINNSSYYLASANDLKYYGGVLSIGGQNIIAKYSSPAIYALYPMSLNTTTTSITNGSVSVLGQNGTFSGNCSVIADATGTLVLPAKTFSNVIRLNTIQTLTASLASGFVTATVTLNNYDYYETNASKAPLFSISTSTLVSSIALPSTQKITTFMQDYQIVGVQENGKENIQLSVFPNPAINSINFTTTSNEATNVVAYDVSGKVVSSEAIESGKSKMNTSNFAPGIYMFRIVGKYNQILTTGKFIVSN